MKHEFYNYDIYPKAFLGDQEKTITIQPLGAHAAFKPNMTYKIEVLKLREANKSVYPERNTLPFYYAKPDADGCLRVTPYFTGEGEWYFRLHEDNSDRCFLSMSVYSLFADMAGRIPQRGDLHLHTRRSDGSQSPAITAANYRGHGYDFTVISDHNRYYPSLECIREFGDISDLAIIPGEEVHLPLNDLHYINFGGTYSINALVEGGPNDEKAGSDLEWRSLNGEAPATMSRADFEAMIRERAKSVPREHEAERLSYAVLEWTYEHMKANGGLGVFVHPHWLCCCMQVPEDYACFVYENQPFDAFEVLGGENYFAQNGFQTGLYYEMRAKGIDVPVVGATDSHSSHAEYNRNALICSTIVFTKSNTREGLIEAIKDKYSVAVDTISTEYRLVGDFRWLHYASFLMENYYPIHDLVCQTEGHYLKRHLNGDQRATEILKLMKGQLPEMQKKYFDL